MRDMTSKYDRGLAVADLATGVHVALSRGDDAAGEELLIELCDAIDGLKRVMALTRPMPTTTGAQR